jgi:hypothetical protein
MRINKDLVLAPLRNVNSVAGMKVKSRSIEASKSPLADGALLSYSDFAKLVGCCAATIRRLCARGQLKRVVLNARFHRVPSSELSRLAGGAL